MNNNSRCRHSVYAKFDSTKNCPICSTHIPNTRKIDNGWAYEYECPHCETILRKIAAVHGCDPYLEIVRFNTNVLALRFAGIDSFHRPVFKAIGVAVYCGSIDHLFDRTVPEEDIIAFFEDDIADKLVYFGNEFNCEPIGTSIDMFTVAII